MKGEGLEQDTVVVPVCIESMCTGKINNKCFLSPNIVPYVLRLGGMNSD